MFDLSPASITSLSQTEIVCVAPLHAAGAVFVSVANLEAPAANTTYTYSLAPAVGAVAPASGPMLGHTPITITGNNFLPGALVFFGSASAEDVSVVSASQIACKSPSASQASTVDVKVVNPDQQQATKASAFTYLPPPAIASLSPASGPTAGGTVVTLFGSNFLNGGAVKVDNTTVGTTLVDATSLIFTSPTHAVGPVDITVTNPDGQSDFRALAFSYLAPPSLTSIAPTKGPSTGGTAITLTGAAFRAGATVRLGGITAQSIGFVNSTQITCFTPSGVAGLADVAVSNSDGQTSTLVGGFEYIPPPSITGVSPAQGPTSGGAFITLDGAAFQSGAQVRVAGALASGITVVDPATITCVTPPASGGAAGKVDLVVTNPDGQSALSASAYEYLQPSAVSSPLVATAVAGSSFTYQITGTQNPTSYGAAGLPNGLSLDSVTGKISGTTNALGTFQITLSVTNRGGTGAATLTLTVVAQYPIITSPLAITGASGQALSYTISATGITPIAFSAQPLPAGLSLNGAMISGTPTTEGQTDVTIVASNAAGSDSKTLQITINPRGAPTITSPLTATGTVGSSFSYTIAAAGTAPINFNAVNLPAGLSLAGAVISGTLAGMGTTKVTISASNNLGLDTKTLELTVNATGAPVITSALTANGKVGTSLVYTINASGPGTITLSASGVPTWLALSGATLSGTPNAAGSYEVQLQAANASGTDSKTLRIAIDPTNSNPPVVTGITISRNPARTDTDVVFSASANSLSGLPLAYTWHFIINKAEDGAPLAGQSVTRSFAQEGEYQVRVYASDGYATSQPGTAVLTTLAPNSGGQGTNTAAGQVPVVDPENGLGIKVTGSLGGVLDVEVLPGTAVAGETYETDFSNGRAPVTGTAIATKYDHAKVYVITTSALQNGLVTRKVRSMIPVSRAETGEPLGYTAEPAGHGFQAPKLKGKCTFGKKTDTLTFQGTVELPAGMDVSQSVDVSIGVGNIVGDVRVSSKGKQLSSEQAVVKKVQVKFPRPAKGTTVTKAGDKATVAVTFTGQNLDELGLDSEGMTNSLNYKPKTKYPLKIHLAMVLGGVAYLGSVDVDYTYSDTSGGAFVNRK